MTTVYVVTAGSGDTYRIERVYLDSDQPTSSRSTTTVLRPVEPVQVEEWQTGAPPGAYDGPYWRAEWSARCRRASAEVSCGTPVEGERFDDFDIRQEWFTGEALPEAKMARRELAGVPRVEVVGLSQGKGRGTVLDTITQVRADLAAVPRKGVSAHLPKRWKTLGIRLDIAARVRHDRFMDQHALERLGHHIVSQARRAELPQPHRPR